MLCAERCPTDIPARPAPITPRSAPKLARSAWGASVPWAATPTTSAATAPTTFATGAARTARSARSSKAPWATCRTCLLACLIDYKRPAFH